MRRKTSKWIHTFAVLLCLMVLTGSMPMTPIAAEPKDVPVQTSGEDGLAEEQASGEDGLVEEQASGEDGLEEEQTSGEDGLAEEQASGEDGLAEEQTSGEDGLAEEQTSGEDGLAEEQTSGEDGLAEELTSGVDGLEEEQTSGEDGLAEELTSGEDGLEEEQTSGEDGLDEEQTSGEDGLDEEQTSGEDGLDEEQDPETGDQTGEEDSSAENQNGEKEPSEGDLTVEEYPDEEAADSPARNDGAADIYAPVEDETDNSITSDRQMTNNLLADSQAHEHNDVHFEPWNSVDSLPSEGGSYYLTEDVTLTEKWTLSSGTLNLCLNGHTICGKGHSRDQVISIEGEGTVLNLYDDGGGTITQENCSQASLVVLSKPAVFNMYGGTIRGAVASGVRVMGGSFTMYGGTITDNLNWGVTVDEYSDKDITISGSVKITDNKRGTGWGRFATGNLFLKNSERKIQINGSLGDSLIGITTNAGKGILTNGLPGNGDADNFKYDDDDYEIWLNAEGEAIVDNPHITTWSELQKAMTNGIDVILEENINGEYEKTLEVYNSVVVDLNGHTIDRGMPDRGGNVIKIDWNGSLTIKDSSPDKSGTITGGSTRSPGGGVYVGQGCTFIMDGGSIYGNSTMDNDNCQGGGVYVGQGATFIMNDGSIINNSTYAAEESEQKGPGGGVYVGQGAAFIMNGGFITENWSQGSNTCQGGGVYVGQGAAFTMNGGTINDNISTGNGSGVYVADNSTFSFNNNAQVTDNLRQFDDNDNEVEKTENIYLAANAMIHITEPLDGARAGVTMMEEKGVFTQGLKGNGNASAFTSDTSEYRVVLNDDGEALLTEKPAPCVIKGVSGSFNDKIKLNYYFDIPESVVDEGGAYVIITNGATAEAVTLPVDKAVFVEGKGFKFSIPLAAKEASDTITARLFDQWGNELSIQNIGGDTDYAETGVQYSLAEYLTWLENHAENGQERAVGAAAKDYCTAAQIYFDYNADGLSVSSAVNTVTAETMSEYASTRKGDLPEGVSIRGISAMLESNNTLRLYLGFNDVDPYSFIYSIDGSKVDLKQRSTDGAYYLALESGVDPNHLQDEHIYSVSDGSYTYSIKASVLTYARSCVITKNTKISNLGKTLYLYNKAAVAAFGDEE